jgi:hypothetical protein
MKLIPLSQWICDSCNQMIEKAEEGWLEWYELKDGNQIGGFRIVHNQEECHYRYERLIREGKHISDNHLQYFTGYDGLASLLTMFDCKTQIDSYELADIIRRIHLPYYEEARTYWEEAKVDGFIFGERHSVRDFQQGTLLNLITRYGGHGQGMTGTDDTPGTLKN